MITESKQTTNSAGLHTLTASTRSKLSNAQYQPHKKILDFGLNEEQINEFWENGFIYLKNIFTNDDIQQWDKASNKVQELESILDSNNLRVDLIKDKYTQKNIAWKLDPFHDLDLTFNSLVSDRRILDKLASLYEGREPFLFKDKLIYKPPAGHGNGLHQDYIWWQGFPTSLISVMIAIDPGTKENGCTTLFPGHRKGLLVPKGTFGDIDHKKVEMEKATYIESQPGDIALFHCMTPHMAKENKSKFYRRQFFITYNDSKDGEHYQAHRHHYHWYMSKSKNDPLADRPFFFK